MSVLSTLWPFYPAPAYEIRGHVVNCLLERPLGQEVRADNSQQICCPATCEEQILPATTSVIREADPSQASPEMTEATGDPRVQHCATF